MGAAGGLLPLRRRAARPRGLWLQSLTEGLERDRQGCWDCGIYPIAVAEVGVDGGLLRRKLTGQCVHGLLWCAQGLGWEYHGQEAPSMRAGSRNAHTHTRTRTHTHIAYKLTQV